MNATATAELNPGSDLARETVFLSVSFGTLGNSRKLAASALNLKGAAGTVNAAKKLLDSPELERIASRDGEIRRAALRLCLPFENGIHLLSRAAVEQVRELLSNYADVERPRLVNEFMEAYPRRREDGIRKITRLALANGWELNSVLRANDYPSESEVRRRFYCEFSFLSLGVPDNLPEEIRREEMAKSATKWREASDEITAVMRFTLAELVTHLRDRLTPEADGKAKVLRETAVTNLTEFLSTFQIRNVTNDTELANLAAQCRAILNPAGIKVDAEFLRNSDSLRERVASDLGAVKSELDKLVTAKPTRKFRFEESD